MPSGTCFRHLNQKADPDLVVFEKWMVLQGGLELNL